MLRLTRVLCALFKMDLIHNATVSTELAMLTSTDNSAKIIDVRANKSGQTRAVSTMAAFYEVFVVNTNSLLCYYIVRELINSVIQRCYSHVAGLTIALYEL